MVVMIPGLDFGPMMGATGPSLGDFVEGGFFAAIISIAGSDYALIISQKSGGETPLLGRLTWGPDIVTGATSENDGPGNTGIIMAASGSHPAAEFCAGLSLNGYSDWYLPARGELFAILDNNEYLPPSEQLLSGSNRYWSSTEFSASSAWVIISGGGGAAIHNKDGGTNLPYSRAIRRVEI